MVKYQFTSEDAENQMIQVPKLQEIIEQQANFIKQLKLENYLLKLQLQELSQQQDKTQQKYESNSDLLGIKEENQNKVVSIFSPLQNDKQNFQSESGILNKSQNLFTQTSNNQYQNVHNVDPNQQHNPFQNSSNFQFSDGNIFSDKQCQSSQVEYEKASQQNNNQTFLDAINQPEQKQSVFVNIFNNSGPSNINNLFSNEVINEENQKQQIHSQEDQEQESLLFGDPSNSYYNVQKSENKTSNNGQLFNQEEQINGQDIKQLENSKEISSQNSSSFKPNSNEKQEEFQIIEKNEESNSI